MCVHPVIVNTDHSWLLLGDLRRCCAEQVVPFFLIRATTKQAVREPSTGLPLLLVFLLLVLALA